jgi:putative addiction module component (TIGR02574 family)
MSQAAPNFDFSQLNSAEKLDLISHLWDSFGDASDALPLPQWHRDELERRLTSAEETPDAAVPWDEVQARLRNEP